MLLKIDLIPNLKLSQMSYCYWIGALVAVHMICLVIIVYKWVSKKDVKKKT